ncbi:MAG TPA: hypothetical protein VF546_04625 [Pyrinomonadaceae bacterium]|jgi:hypothetical protein
MSWSLRPAGRLWVVGLCLALGALAPARAQEQKDKPKYTEAELSAARKVEAGKDAQARLAAAGEFLKKYPKSELRPQVAQLVAQKVDEVTDPAQVITLADSFRAIFNEPAEADLLTPNLLTAYLKANRLEDAYKLAAAGLDKLPNPVGALIELTNAANNQVRQQDTQYVPQGIQYAGRAIELIEADKKPAAVSDAVWAEYKTKQLPQLYQVQGFLLLIGGDAETAKTKLAKATALNPADPQTYWILGRVRDNDYQDMVTKYKATPAGPAQDELLKQAQAQLDQIIDDYAHVVALAEGSPQHKDMHDQALQALQSYYQYRHNGSTNGMKELIAKYKRPAQ